MKKILISAIGGDIGYGVIKALKASNQELYFIGFDMKKYNASLDLMDEFYISPAYKEEEKWLRFVTNLIKEHQVDYFWPITEPEMKLVDKNRNLFADISVIINKPYILDIALNKQKTAQVLSEAGICTPKTWNRVEACEEQYPLIVKESFGCGSHSVELVNSRKELVQAFSEMQAPIIQEYIGNANDEYTLAIFSDQKIVNYITFKRTLGFGGMSRYVELADDEDIGNIAHNVAKLLRLEGSINVQMRKENGKYYVFEINPRISSTIGFRLQLGFNDAAWWFDMINGKSIDQYNCPNKKVYGVRTVEEKIFYE